MTSNDKVVTTTTTPKRIFKKVDKSKMDMKSEYTKSNNSTESISTDDDSSSEGLDESNNSSFQAIIGDGYSFRNMIEFLKVTSARGNFVISHDKIAYEQSDISTNTYIINQVVINTSELTKYEFDSKEQFFIGVNIEDIRTVSKTIGKKDSIKLYKVFSDPFLYIQIISNNSRGTDRENMNVIRPQSNDVYQFKCVQYSNDERNPNCKIMASEFAKVCTSMSSLKCDYVTIYGLPCGIVFQGGTPGRTSERIEKFGVVDGFIPSSCDSISIDQLEIPSCPRPKLNIKYDKSNVQPVKIKVKISIIKSLSKLNNLSTNGTIKLFIEQDKPLKILCPIGNYGILRTYILPDNS